MKATNSKNLTKPQAIHQVELLLKKEIINGVNAGFNKQKITAKLNTIIERYIKYFSKEDREHYRKALISFSMAVLNDYSRKMNNLLSLLIVALGVTYGAKNNKHVFSVNDAFKVIDDLESRQKLDSLRRGYPQLSNYKKIVKEEMKSLIESIVREQPVIDKTTGRKYYGRSLYAKAQRDVRFEIHMKQLENFRARGIDLVYVPGHANCSRRCQKWQERYYTLDGTTRNINGHQFIPIEKAIDVFVKTKSGKVWRNGLFGFNCRHTMVEYHPGFVEPKRIQPDVIAKQRKIEEKQRRLERDIYNLNRSSFLLDYSPLKEDRIHAVMLRKKASALTKYYFNFCKNNKIPAYPENFKTTV